MALGATVYVFEVRLADADRGVYDTLTIRAARHPSETAEYMVTRLLAYASSTRKALPRGDCRSG
jgi:uncharacterized protein YaeQ